MVVTDPKKIMLIDDNPAGIAWLKEYLEETGREVTLVSSFPIAIDLLRVRPPKFDLVTIDLMMPVPKEFSAEFDATPQIFRQFPGLLLARTARNQGYGSKRVVLYSVQETEDVAEEAERLGVEYFVKGRPRDLKTRLEKTLSR